MTLQPRLFLTAAFAISLSGGSVLAQDPGAQSISLPEACRKAELPGNMGGMGMGGMMENMQQTMGDGMSPATRAHLQAIAAMHPPMMQGAMAQDPDLAFNCAMIAHHQGAIAMARVEIQHGMDEEARKTAQNTIDQQSREVQEMSKWVEEHAGK